jgi:hypothetical protein
MPSDPKAPITILPDGSRTVVPIDMGTTAAGLRIEVRGTVRCAYNNQEYDALYACDRDGVGDEARPHNYLAWWPRKPEIESANIRSHRYVFRFPAIAAGVSPTVGIDVDRFVRDFLISPSEVRSSLSGQFEAAVLPPPIAAPSPWTLTAAAVPVLLFTGGVAWVIRRRMANPALDYDLQLQLQRIRQKARAARAAVRREDVRLVQIGGRLTTLEQGAGRLVKQAQRLRGALALQNRPALDKQILKLQQETENHSARVGVHRTLQEKRKALAAVTRLEEAAAVCILQLTRIEAVVENTLAGLHTVQVESTEAGTTDTVCQALDAEVSALREATSLVREEHSVVELTN